MSPNQNSMFLIAVVVVIVSSDYESLVIVFVVGLAVDCKALGMVGSVVVGVTDVDLVVADADSVAVVAVVKEVVDEVAELYRDQIVDKCLVVVVVEDIDSTMLQQPMFVHWVDT